MKGFKQLSLLLCAGIVGALIGVFTTMQMPNLSAAKTTVHEHDLVAHANVAATCTTQGNRAYWECPQCEMYFSDEFGAYQITAAELKDWVIIDPLKHQTNENYHTHYQMPTCASAGNIDYYVCMNGCGKYFTDANCQIEIKDKNVTLAKKTVHSLSNVSYVPAKNATCAEPGNKAHWVCNTCEQTFLNPNCTQPSGDVVLTVNHESDQEHFTAYQAPTCLTTGHLAYYDCKNCGQHFHDINCYEKIDDIVIAKKEHNSYASHYTPYQAPTCEKAGHNAYYTCQNGCNQKYADVNCENLLTEEQINIDALGHHYVLEKVNANQVPEYKVDEHGNLYHGWLDYQFICDHEGCRKFNGGKEVGCFARIDHSNNYSQVTSSIQADTEIYDFYELDWSASRIKTDAQGEYTEIVIFIPGTYNENSNYYDNGVEVTDMSTVVRNYSVKLIVRANQITQGENLLWKFDWDGDGNYEQIIKVKVNNYN